MGRRSFCESGFRDRAGLRQRDGGWGQKLAFILGSCLASGRGAHAASNERVATRFPSRREPRIGGPFSFSATTGPPNSGGGAEICPSPCYTPHAAVGSPSLILPPQLPLPLTS